jgi:hypothetical protein
MLGGEIEGGWGEGVVFVCWVLVFFFIRVFLLFFYMIFFFCLYLLQVQLKLTVLEPHPLARQLFVLVHAGRTLFF